MKEEPTGYKFSPEEGATGLLEEGHRGPGTQSLNRGCSQLVMVLLRGNNGPGSPSTGKTATGAQAATGRNCHGEKASLSGAKRGRKHIEEQKANKKED